MFVSDYYKDKNSNFLKLENYLQIIFILFFIIIVGFRYKVGSDWNTYNDIFEQNITSKSYEFGYVYFIWLSNIFNTQIWGLNLFAALVFFIGYYSLFKNEKYFWFSLNLAIPYLIFIVAMGYTRQSISIGFGMFLLYSIVAVSFS